MLIFFVFCLQGAPPGDREQDVAAQPGDGVWADAAATGAGDGETAKGRTGVEHGGRDGPGGDIVLLPAGTVEVEGDHYTILSDYAYRSVLKYI